jgi:hypothetical protein
MTTQNLNLQQNNNFQIIIKSDELFNSKEVTFYITDMVLPGFSIPPVEENFNGINIPYPTQGKMSYDQLTMTIRLDDNFNDYLELLRWLHRLKDPEKLLKAPANTVDVYNPKYQQLKNNLLLTKQFPIEYRTIFVNIKDTNHQTVLQYEFVDAWVNSVGGITLSTKSSEYMTADISFYFSLIKIYDAEGKRLIPELDINQTEDRYLEPVDETTI